MLPRNFWIRCVCRLVVPLLVALPVLWALLPGGLPNTADGTIHFIRAVEMLHAWQDGVPLPRWSENLGYGYGIPLFVYAPPLPYLLAVALSYLGMTLETAFKGMMVVSVLVAAFGAYALGRTVAGLWTPPDLGSKSISNQTEYVTKVTGVWAGAIGAAAFLYAPIMLRELFIQGNIAQFLAWTFPPWAAWAILEIYQQRASQSKGLYRYGHVLMLALALLGTLLSHNVVALLLMGTIGALAIVLAIATRDLRALGLTVAGSGLGLCLGFWFWGPALLESKYVQLHRIVTSDFRSRFIPLADLLALSPPLDSGAINPYFPLTLGAVQVWLGAIGLLVFLGYLARIITTWRISQHRERSSGKSTATSRKVHEPASRLLLVGTGAFFSLFTLFCGFMATAWSVPIWDVLPFVALFEWPFRWHGFTALGLSWLCAFGVFALAQAAYQTAQRWLAVWRPYAHIGGALVASTALLLLIGSALVNLYPQKLLPGTRIASPYEVARYEVKSSAVGTTSLGEFNPIWVDGTLQPSPLVDDYLARQPIDRLPTTLPSGASGAQTESEVHRQQFRLSLPQPARLTLNLLYFPGWRATIDGQPVPIRPHEQSGLIDVDLPAGDHTLVLTFGPTPLRRIAGLISLAAWIAVVLYVVMFGLRQLTSLYLPGSLELPGRSSPRIETGAPWTTAAMIGAVVAALLVARATQAQHFVRHSPPDQNPTMDVSIRADFEDKLRLLGVDLPSQTVAPGQPLTVVAYWRSLQALEDDYSVFLHLDIPTTGETIATIDQLHPSDIPTSGWAIGQYVRNPLTLETPADALPIQYSLHIGVYDRDGNLLELTDGVQQAARDTVEVGRIWVTPSSKPKAPDGPQIRFGENLELLGIETSSEAVTLYWRAQATIGYPYSVFVHLLDDDGNLLGQLDGAPYTNRYPLSAWQPGKIIVDRRSLATVIADTSTIARLAIGIYDPRSGARLPAVGTADMENANLLNDALLVEFR